MIANARRADLAGGVRVERAAARSRGYLLAIVVMQATFLAVVMSRAWFLSDDLENFGLAHDNGLTLKYLRIGIFGHFAPGHRLLDWFVFNYWPLDWRAPALMTITMLLATSWVLYRIVRLLAPTESWPTLLIALFAFSPAVSGTVTWWAALGHSVPAMLFVSIATLVALRFSRTPTFADAVVFGVALAGGLLFYEKTALAPLGIAALIWATHDQRGVRAMTQLVRRCVPLVGICAVLLGAWAIEIKTGNYDQGLPSPTPGNWWQWFTRMVTAGPFASGAGVNSNAYHGAVRDTLLFLAGTATILVVTVSIVRFRGAWRAWVFFGLAFFPGILLTAYGRAALFGPGTASDPHYLTELAPALVLALVVAFTRPRRARSPVRPSTGGRSRRVNLVMIALVPVLLVSAVSGVRAADNSAGPANRRYFDNLERSSSALHLSDRPGRYTVLNGDVPFRVVPTAFAPYNQVAEVLPLLPATRGQDFVIDGKPLLMVLANGTIVRARLHPIRSLTPVPGASCIGPTTVHVPKSRQQADDRTMLFAALQGVPAPVTVTISKSAAPGVMKKVGPYAGPQLISGSPDGQPVRVLAIGKSDLTITPSVGSCLDRFTLLAAEPAQQRTPQASNPRGPVGLRLGGGGSG